MDKKQIRSFNHKNAWFFATTIIPGEASDMCILTLAAFVEFHDMLFTFEEIFKKAFPKNGIKEERKKEIIKFLKDNHIIHSKKYEDINLYYLEERYESLVRDKII